MRLIRFSCKIFDFNSFCSTGRLKANYLINNSSNSDLITRHLNCSALRRWRGTHSVAALICSFATHLNNRSCRQQGNSNFAFCKCNHVRFEHFWSTTISSVILVSNEGDELWWNANHRLWIAVALLFNLKAPNQNIQFFKSKFEFLTENSEHFRLLTFWIPEPKVTGPLGVTLGPGV